MTELPRHIEDQIEQIYLNTQRRLIQEKLKDIQESVGGVCTVDVLKTKVEEFNSIINEVTGDDEELYDMYRFRMFTKGVDVILLQRPKIVSEIDQIYEVNDEVYNLIDYDEVDVDVRRYGTGEV